PELQAFLRWSKPVPDWKLDDTSCDRLARLSIDEFTAGAGAGRLFGPDSGFAADTVRWSLGRPLESTSRVEADADAVDAGIVCFGGPCFDRNDPHLAHRCTDDVSRRGQCNRYARPAN